MFFRKFILSRGLLKTGQVIEYQAGDDGTYEAGWWKGRLNANNRTRFLTRTIGGDDIVLDRATGLMWAADGDEAGCNNGATITWANGITYANGLTFADFSDWRMPNIKELFSIVTFNIWTPAIDEPPFANTPDRKYWSSTTFIGDTTQVWLIDFTRGKVDYELKTEEGHIRCVRKGL